MKWIYPLMAWPVEPFHTIHNWGNGLNSHERANLLDVVLTVCFEL